MSHTAQLWQPDAKRVTPTNNASASAGEIVGTAIPTGVNGCCTDKANLPNSDQAAFIYRNKKAFDLNSLLTGRLAKDVYLNSAVGINNSGQIVAVGIDLSSDSEETAGYLLTPVR